MARPTKSPNAPFMVEDVALDALTPHPRNYQTHPDDELTHIMESITTHGFYRNVVNWKKFKAPLKLKPSIDLDALKAQGPNEYGMELRQVRDEIKSPRVRALLEDWQVTHGAA